MVQGLNYPAPRGAARFKGLNQSGLRGANGAGVQPTQPLVVEMGLIQPLKPCRIEASSYTLISSGNSFKKWEHRKWECPILSIPIEAVESTSRIEVLVKAEHDFYREKWQKEQKKKMRFHLTCDKMRHILRG
jgi:hypothetical protein